MGELVTASVPYRLQGESHPRTLPRVRPGRRYLGPPVQLGLDIPSFTVDPTMLAVGGGLLVLALLLKKPIEKQRRRSAKRTALRKQISGLEEAYRSA